MTALPDRLPEGPVRYFSFIVFLYSFFHLFLEIIILYTKMNYEQERNVVPSDNPHAVRRRASRALNCGRSHR